MKKPEVIFSTPANFDLSDISEFLRENSDILHETFLEELDKYLQVIIENPFLFRKIHLEIRKVEMKKFGYVLVYDVLE